MRDKNRHFQTNRSLQSGKNILDLSRPRIMGVLNVTPDSFFDGGRYTDEKTRIEQTRKMLAEGADIIDLGAVSTRPGAAEVSKDEELKRLLPTLKALVSEFPDVLFSIDTYRSEVAEQCLKAGASIINDISGGMLDAAIYEAVVKFNVPYILMHMLGTPKTMQQNPLSENSTQIVKNFFEERVQYLSEKGITNIILDPGFGFGKTIEGNYLMLEELEKLRINNLPILVGVSRKSMIYKKLNITPQEALNGTTVVNTIALLNGADILRVHDVKEVREAIELTSFYRKKM
ncbi:MAG: dihydropteroate synthase [Bacteroidales bacterium]|nr:dihydropteroate synthase [Bacteroidales bacterium]